MGLSCSKKQQQDGDGPITVRLSPWRRRSLSRTRSFLAEPDGPGPLPLLSIALDALLASLDHIPRRQLAKLPPDLSQLLLEGLVAAARLDDATVRKLSGLGLHFFSLPLGAYPETVQPFWLTCLSTPSLEAADLSKTEGMDEVLACLGPTPHLSRLCLDFCVDLTDGGLALLQGMRSMQDLSLAGCELLTGVGMEQLRGLTRMRRLNLQTCHQISLAPLSQMSQLERLDAGWCSSLGDIDAAVLQRMPRLQELNLACTQISDEGLACLHSLVRLQELNLAGVKVSDDALAALLFCLPELQVLNLERCKQAGDACLAAVSKKAHQLRELYLGYTAVSDKWLRLLERLTQLQVLSLESCAVGDSGLAVLGHLTNMRQLDLSDTNAGNGCMCAVASMRHLERLNLSFTSVNDLGLESLSRLSHLRCLNLDSRHFTDSGMASVAQLSALECLDLFGARIGDDGCAKLSKLKSLRRLEVCGGGVTDTGVAHLTALSRLQHLSVAQNYRVTNNSIKHIMKLDDLCALNLSQCHVTCKAVVALGCLPKLQTLSLYETKVKPFAVDTLLAANPDLCVQGVAPSKHA